MQIRYIKKSIAVMIMLQALTFMQVEKSVAQTVGSLTFSVTTSEPSGGYTGKHVLALWLKDASGNFIKTKIKYATVRQQYLNQWVSSSGTNVVDAVTGATLTSHGTRTFSWDGTNTLGLPVPDGVYSVWIQMADANTNGPTASVQFTKGPAGVALLPADNGNFSNMSLKWSPVVTSAPGTASGTGFNVYPGSTRGLINIIVPEQGGDVKVTILNIAGITVLSQKFSPPSGSALRIDLGGLHDGIYLVDVVSGGKAYCSKVILHR